MDSAYSRTKNPINGQSVVATDSTGSQIISKRRRTTGLKPAINGLRQRTGNKEVSVWIGWEAKKYPYEQAGNKRTDPYKKKSSSDSISSPVS